MSSEELSKKLIEAGFTPGEDFGTSNEGGFFVSSRAKDYILEAAPKEEKDRIRKIFEHWEDDPWKKLENHLGVPFFENLKQIVSERVKTLTDDEAIHYLYHITEGFGKKHPQIGNQFSAWLIYDGIGMDRWKSIQQRLNQDSDDIEIIDETNPNFGIWMIDLIKAAGGDQYVTQREDGEPIVYEGALAFLEEVFQRKRDY